MNHISWYTNNHDYLLCSFHVVIVLLLLLLHKIRLVKNLCFCLSANSFYTTICLFILWCVPQSDKQSLYTLCVYLRHQCLICAHFPITYGITCYCKIFWQISSTPTSALSTPTTVTVEWNATPINVIAAVPLPSPCPQEPALPSIRVASPQDSRLNRRNGKRRQIEITFQPMEQWRQPESPQMKRVKGNTVKCIEGEG